MRGKAPTGFCGSTGRKDHPRMCGEKPERLFGAGDRSWITPACAGKSTGCQNRRQSVQDHPRMCGEKQRSAESVTIPMGSPPHVRGKDRLWQKRFHEVGITPACAGKRRAQDRQDPPRGDHPRMCGEKWLKRKTAAKFIGSPPHVRGKVKLVPERGVTLGITPACAGKSRIRPRTAAAFGDHPRMCGEK